MANLTKNLELLQNGKQKIIDKINSKLAEKDQERLEITCLWEEINDLLAKVKVKKNRSEELDTSEIYSEICDDTRNRDIITNVTSIGDYSLYNQQYLPKLTANSCTNIGIYALSGCSALTEVELENCKTIGNYAFRNTTALKQLSLPKLTTCEQYAFQNSGITTIDIALLTTIPAYGFQNCVSLNVVNAPSVTIIGDYAFNGATNLNTLSVKHGADISIGNYALANCTAFEGSSLFEQAISVGEYAFNKSAILTATNSKLTALNSNNIFQGCKNLELIDLQKCTSLTGSHTFEGCTALRSVNLPNVVSLGSTGSWTGSWCAPFENCDNIESFYAPKVTTLYCAFYGGTKITTLSFPALAGISWGGSIFWNLPELISLDLPALQYYKSSPSSSYFLVSDCYKLSTVNLANFYGIVDNTAYSGCSYFGLFRRLKLSEVLLPKIKGIYPDSAANVMYDMRYLNKLNLDNLQVAQVSSYDGTFNLVYGCPNLTELTLPNLVTSASGKYFIASINGGVDYSCKDYIMAQLQYYRDLYPTTYETNDTYIMWYERLNGGTVDGTLANAAPYNNGYKSSIGYNLSWCGIKKLVLPKISAWHYTTSTSSSYYRYFCYMTHELEELWMGDGNYTPTTAYFTSRFIYGAYKLRRVVLNFPVVLTAYTSLTNIFFDCPHLDGTRKYFTQTVGGVSKNYYYANEAGAKDLYFYVPDDLVEKYRVASNWSTYASQIRPMSELAALNIDSTTTTITESEYENDKTLTSVAGFGIEKIEDRGFYNTSATSLYFSNLKQIGNYAFAESTNLSSITINNTATTEVGEGAYAGTKIESINLPLLTTINKDTFKNCKSLTVATLAAVKLICEGAFENTGLTDISYSTLKKINARAFKDCNNLSTLTLPVVTNIADNAFENTGLTTLSLPLVTVIQKAAFKNSTLSTVSIPKIMIIDDEAFANNTALKTINLYEAMQIGNDVFDGCTSLTDITFTGYTVPVCGNLPETCTLHVRAEVVDDYKVAFPKNVVVGDVA